MAVRFGDCRLDVDARRLFLKSREVHLTPKAFELLRVLLEAHPRALSKNELLERVWPGVFVSDASLAKVVNQVRNGVGDTARRNGIIRTVHGYGYAFAAEIEKEPSARKAPAAPARARCWLLLGQRKFPLADGEHFIGREPDAGIWLDSVKVSRRHARIEVQGTRATIEDLGSKNGTFVGDNRIARRTSLTTGDRIHVGSFVLTFRCVTESRSTETAL